MSYFNQIGGGEIFISLIILLANIYYLYEKNKSNYIDCQYKEKNWVNVGICDKTTGKQKQKKGYKIIRRNFNGGKVCPTEDIREINCDVDCEFTSSEWKDSGSCNCNTRKIKQERNINMIINKRNNGKCDNNIIREKNCFCEDELLEKEFMLKYLDNYIEFNSSNFSLSTNSFSTNNYIKLKIEKDDENNYYLKDININKYILLKDDNLIYLDENKSNIYIYDYNKINNTIQIKVKDNSNNYLPIIIQENNLIIGDLDQTPITLTLEECGQSCPVDCLTSEWTNWKDIDNCSEIETCKGTLQQNRTREVLTEPINGGICSIDLEETREISCPLSNCLDKYVGLNFYIKHHTRDFYLTHGTPTESRPLVLRSTSNINDTSTMVKNKEIFTLEKENGNYYLKSITLPNTYVRFSTTSEAILLTPSKDPLNFQFNKGGQYFRVSYNDDSMYYNTVSNESILYKRYGSNRLQLKFIFEIIDSFNNVNKKKLYYGKNFSGINW